MSARIEGHEEPDGDLTKSLDELKRRLEEIMGRPKVTVRDAEEAAEAARALADLLRGQERALRLLRAAQPLEPTSATGSAQGPGHGSLAGIPLYEAARRVLETLGWPMHVEELGLRIKSAGWRHPRSTNAKPGLIQYQLAAQLPRHPETFKRFGPNRFGLVAWGDSPPQTAAPKPRLGIVSSGEPYTGPSARWLGEHPEEWYDDMVRDERG